MGIDIFLKIVFPVVSALLVIFGLVAKFYRPIYYSFSNKYNKTSISDSGELVDLSIQNFGLHTESNIKLELANNLRIHLITNMEEVTLSNNMIKIERVNRASVTNILILIEGGTFNKDSIVSAKTNEKDIDYRQTQETRGSYLQVAFVILLILSALLFIGTMGYLAGEIDGKHEAEMRHMQETTNKYSANITNRATPEIIRRTARLEALGWQSLDEDLFSEKFSSAYGDDFPIKLLKAYEKDGMKYFDFEIMNKFSEFFEVNVWTLKSYKGDKPQSRISETSSWSGPVLPSTKELFSLKLYLPAKNDGQVKYFFKFVIRTKDDIYAFVLALDA